MASSYLERELKFDVDQDFVLPDLSDLLPSDGWIEARTERLRSDYFDTVDRDLLLASITLRHRSATTEVGWQLKLGRLPSREEIHLDGTSEWVPDELNSLLLGVRCGNALGPVATVFTERSAIRLLDGQGNALAEVADDTVRASAAHEGTATASSWREVEVELGTGSKELLESLGKRLRRSGAQRSRSASKLARAVVMDRCDHQTARAGDVVARYFAEQRRALLAGDLALRLGRAEAIHDTRVAARRLRSILKVFSRLFDESPARQLEEQLRWYAGLLGEVRDRQVLRDRLDTKLDDLDETVRFGPVKAYLHAELALELGEAERRLHETLAHDRYLALVRQLRDWELHPPFTAAARRSPGSITKQLERANRKVAGRLRGASHDGTAGRLHRARKAAKRARYAAEAAEPVIGHRRTRSQARKYRRLQDLLGEHQDSLVSAEFVRRLGASTASVGGQNGFAFGILYERELRAAERTRRRVDKLVKRCD